MVQLFVFQLFELILMGIVFFLFLIQILYYLLDLRRPYKMIKRGMNKNESGDSIGTNPPVSIIIYAKNESVNLQENLPAILNQDYPEFQVIVVNDGSTDESDDILKAFELKYKNLYHTFIPEEAKYVSRKKLAMTVGIKAAKYDYLLFIEANCHPQGSQWISSMMSTYEPQTDIVIGFASYIESKGFFHKLVGYDNLLSGMRMMSSALCRRPFTATGSNLSYRKSLFFDNKGFSDSLELHAGEDDLFVNETATSTNTEVLLNTEGLTAMMPYYRFKVWKEMKVSQAATRRFYRGWQMAYYRMEVFTRFLFWIAALFTAIYCLINSLWIIGGSALLLLFIRLIIAERVMYKSSIVLGQQFSVFSFPFLEVFLPIYELYVWIYRIFRGKNDFTFRFR